MLSRHLVIKRRRWFYHTPVAVSSAQLKHVNPFNSDVLIVVIEHKVSVVTGFNAFIMVNEFIMFTECMLFMRHLVSDCECWAGRGPWLSTLHHTQCPSQEHTLSTPFDSDFNVHDSAIIVQSNSTTFLCNISFSIM